MSPVLLVAPREKLFQVHTDSEDGTGVPVRLARVPCRRRLMGGMRGRGEVRMVFLSSPSHFRAGGTREVSD